MIINANWLWKSSDTDRISVYVASLLLDEISDSAYVLHGSEIMGFMVHIWESSILRKLLFDANMKWAKKQNNFWSEKK